MVHDTPADISQLLGLEGSSVDVLIISDDKCSPTTAGMAVSFFLEERFRGNLPASKPKIHLSYDLTS